MEKKFKPFERIIYKEKLFNGCRWHCAFFSDYNESNGCVNFADGKHYHFTKIDILPYEGNEELVGTTKDPVEEVRLEEGEYCFFCNSVNSKADMWIFDKLESLFNDQFYSIGSDWCYAIRFKDFDPYNMKETLKHILEVKNGKIIRYKISENL